MSRLEAGKVDLHLHPTDLHRSLSVIADLFRKACLDKDLDLRIDFDGETAGRWMLDETRVRQIVVNLVGNAVKFTLDGSVTVRTERIADGVRISVVDTGIGMTDEAAQRIFDPFTQAETDTTRRFGGTGLGLGISKHLVDIMGGHISVSSETGVGSTFMVELPLEKVHETEAKPLTARIAQKVMVFDAQVLLVEDDGVNAAVATAHLKKLGCEVVRAADGAEAVNAVNRATHPFDLILMDMMMPVMDGLEATRRIRALEAQRASGWKQPIVALSANVLPEDTAKAAEAGVDDYLAKPFKRDDLVVVLQALRAGSLSHGRPAAASDEDGE